MTVTYEFKLPDQYEERREWEMGPGALRVLGSMARELRRIRKYGEGVPRDVLEEVQRLEEYLYSAAGHENVEVWV